MLEYNTENPLAKSVWRATRKPERKTVSIRLDTDRLDRLNAIVDITQAGSLHEMIIQAIALYEGVVAEVVQGNDVVVVDKSGKEPPMSIFVNKDEPPANTSLDILENGQAVA